MRRFGWWQVAAISFAWATVLVIAAQVTVSRVAHQEWIMVASNTGVFTYDEAAKRRIVGVWLTALVLWVGGTTLAARARSHSTDD